MENQLDDQKKKNRGFAAMSPEKRKEIARKGGLAISSNREHMASIGSVGGERSGKTRARKLK